jgi:hypothetical protein
VRLAAAAAAAAAAVAAAAAKVLVAVSYSCLASTAHMMTVCLVGWMVCYTSSGCVFENTLFRR